MKKLLIWSLAIMFLTAGGLMASNDDTAESKIFPYKYHMKDLKNGLRVIVIPTDYPNIVALQIPVRGRTRPSRSPSRLPPAAPSVASAPAVPAAARRPLSLSSRRCRPDSRTPSPPSTTGARFRRSRSRRRPDALQSPALPWAGRLYPADPREPGRSTLILGSMSRFTSLAWNFR